MRIDKFPGIFELCKIYVTIKNNNSNLEFLCKEIKSEYAQFPNLIICIYNDTEMGKNLAVGNVEFSGSSEQAEAWLAMYSYNSVEGEFYNNMPGAYIGINNQGKYK